MRQPPILSSRFCLLLLAAVWLAGCGEAPSGEPGDLQRCAAGERRVIDAQGKAQCEPITGGDDTSEPSDTEPADTGADTAEPSDTATDDTDGSDPGDSTLAEDSGSDTGASDTAEPGDTAEDTAPDVVMPPEVTRLVAIGDVGEGSPEQYHVAANIGLVCGQLGGCDFGLLLGDNFYDSGVDSSDDPMFDTHFAQPYGPLGFPFYVVLGNHDLGGDGLGVDLDFQKGDYQVAYSDQNPQWRMPAKHYQVTEGPLWMVALNTTDIFFDQDDNQYAAVSQWLSEYDAAGESRWKIAFGHHPYISNGKHGNAGNYEDIGDWGSWSDIPRGKHVEDFMQDNICGKFDVYICGHDHSLQDLVATCGTEFLISGAGAKTTEVHADRNPHHWQSEATGFVIIDATETSLHVMFYDRDGALSHERTITR